MQTYPPGTRIGQYEIASRPMMGGMGVVYFALDHGDDGRPVALKTFRPELLPDRAARDRFLREGTAWIELGSHPHIVRCYKVEYIDPTAFLVLELIAKEQNMPDASLRSWLIPGRPLPLEQALLFALQIARGMQYATEKIPGFVHRDLKPENILVGADKLPGTNINRLRVTDFGLVKTIAGSDMPAKAGNEEKLKPNQVQFTRGVGTPLYMAPEQWKGEPVGVFTDIYAFGCILYEMMTGRHIVDGTTVNQIREVHCSDRLQPIPESMPRDMSDLLIKCVAFDPSSRFENWHDVTEAIECTYSNQSSVSIPVLEGPTELIHAEQVQVGWSYNAIGLDYLNIGKLELSVRFFERALIMSQNLAIRELEGAASGNLGLVCMDLGDSKRAIEHYEQCLQLHRGISDRQGESADLGNLGNAYFNLGDAQRSIEYYKLALTIDREIGDERGECTDLGNLGLAYSFLGNTQKAIACFEQSLSHSRRIHDKRAEGNILNNMGEAYSNLGDAHKAIFCYEHALDLAQEIGDRLGEGAALGSLGTAYADLGDAQRAINYYEQRLSIALEINDLRGTGNALGNLGNEYQKLGELQRAINCYEQILEIHRKSGDQRREGADLGNLGNVYLQAGDIRRAMDYYEMALNIRHKIGDLNGIATDSFNMALLYAQRGDKARALNLAQSAANTFAEVGHKPNAQRAEQLIIQIQNSPM